MAIVYQHRRLDIDEIFYIGIGKDKRRSKVFHGRSIEWQEIANAVDIKVEILYENISIEQAMSIEIDLIRKHGRQDLGLGTLVNKTDGGEYYNDHKGKIIVHRDKKSKFIYPEELDDYLKIGWIKGRPAFVLDKLKWTEERKREQSKNLSGENGYWYGKKGEGTPMWGKKQSEKFVSTIKSYMNSDRHPMKNKETCKKMAESRQKENHPRAKKIDQFSLDGLYIKSWNCIIDAKKELNIFHIDQVCLGKRKSAGGYIWKYKN